MSKLSHNILVNPTRRTHVCVDDGVDLPCKLGFRFSESHPLVPILNVFQRPTELILPATPGGKHEKHYCTHCELILPVTPGGRHEKQT